MKHIQEFFNKLQSTSSRLDKESILREYQKDENIKRVVYFLFNPYIVTGISKKKFYKDINTFGTPIAENIFELMNHVEKFNHGSDMDIRLVRAFVKANKEFEKVIYAIICKDIALGISAITINKIWGKNFIPVFDVMLAEKYYDAPEKYLPEGTEFIITEKLDGVRCVLIFDEAGDPHFLTRNGKEVEQLVDISEEAKTLNHDYIYDGELLANTTGHSKDVYRDTMSIVGSDNLKQGVIFNVFDRVLKTDFQQGYSAEPAYRRKTYLSADVIGLKWIKDVNILYSGKDQNEITVWLNWASKLGKEGVMLNVSNAGYSCKRSRDLLKVKTFNEVEAYVESIDAGTGRNEHRLGNINIIFKDGGEKEHRCKVGSGFSDGERDYYWEHPNEIVGKVVEVSYFEVSNNKTDNSKSLRFPTWLGRIRTDKTREDMNHI